MILLARKSYCDTCERWFSEGIALGSPGLITRLCYNCHEKEL